MEDTLTKPTIVEWTPTRKQETFTTLPDDIFEVLYGGAAGPGKTEILYMLPLIRQWHLHPRYKGLILRRTFPELEAEIIIRSRPWYESTGAKYNEQKKRWTFPAGGYQAFGHAEHEKDITKYDGVEYNYVGWDELTHFTQYQYLYLVASRVRSSTKELPAITRAGSNPGNIGHTWVRSRFVDPAREGLKIIVDRKTGLKRFYLPARVEDNKHLLENDPTYVAKLEMLPTEAEKRAKKYGDWYTFEGQVFNFRLEPLPDEPINARHVIEPFQIPFWWPRVAAIDWGFAAHVWIGWAAIAPDGRVYLYREYFQKRKMIAEWASEFKRLSANDNLETVALDPSAWQNRGVETIDQQFTQYSGYVPERAINDRIGGKLLLHDYLRWTPKPKSRDIAGTFNSELASKLLRNYGQAKYDEYVKFFEEEAIETNLPRLQIFENCQAVIDAIPNCVYDPANPEDVKEFEGDDPYDGVRYLLQACSRYRDSSNRAARRFDHMARMEKFYGEGQKRGDMTQFYIHARDVESKVVPFSVRPRKR